MGTAQRQPEVYRVETVPPPPGEDSAYSAPTKVGPFAQAALARKMMLTAEEPKSGVQAVTKTAPPPRPQVPIAPPRVAVAPPPAVVAPPPGVYGAPPLFVPQHAMAPMTVSPPPATPRVSAGRVLVTVLASGAVMAAAATAWVVFVLGYFG